MSQTVTFFDTFLGGLHRVAKGSNGGTFFKFPRKSVVKGGEGFAMLHTGGVEVASSNLAGPTIFTFVFQGSNAFPTAGPCGRNLISNLNGGKRWGQQLRKKRCGV